MKFQIMKDQVKNQYFVKLFYNSFIGECFDIMKTPLGLTSYFDTVEQAEKFVKDYVEKKDLETPMLIKEINI